MSDLIFDSDDAGYMIACKIAVRHIREILRDKGQITPDELDRCLWIVREEERYQVARYEARQPENN